MMLLALPNGTNLDLKELVKESVLQKHKQGFGIFIYNVYGLGKDIFNNSYYLHQKYQDYELVLAYVNSFSYMDEVGINLSGNDGFNLTNPEKIIAKPGAYLFIVIPTNQISIETKNLASEICSILAISIGKNIVSKHLVNIFNYINSTGQVYSTPINIGKYMSKPNIDRFPINVELNGKLSSLDIDELNRVKTSLRWYYKALFDEGVDSFISFWIAIETIGKAKGSDIKPINETLGRIYKITQEEAKEKFKTGRIFGLRSSIVHFGNMPNIGNDLIDYVDAIYVDLLYEVLKLHSEKRLIEKLGTVNFDNYSFKQN